MGVGTATANSGHRSGGSIPNMTLTSRVGCPYAAFPYLHSRDFLRMGPACQLVTDPSRRKQHGGGVGGTGKNLAPGEVAWDPALALRQLLCDSGHIPASVTSVSS